ncbi:MAG: hypothetical protein PUG48_06525 [Clostridia bacterium]|nr:hypothetical protein [Clostridia bacterium]
MSNKKSTVKSKIKKTLSGLLLSAVVVSSVATASNAVSSVVNVTYSNQNFAYNHTYEPESYFQGYYETSGWGHTQRAGTHYNSGSLYGCSYVKITYVDSNGKSNYIDGISDRQTGWTETPWIYCPNGVTVTSVSFQGIKYSSQSSNTQVIHDYCLAKA